MKLLIEDYGTRTRQWREEAESPAGGDNGPATPPPSSSPPPFSSEAPVTQPPAFSLLLDDYDARSARWWAGFDRSASREPAGPAVPTDLPGPRLLIEDYVPGSFSEWWKPQADRGSVSDIAALGTTAVSASEPPALPVSGTDGDLALDVEWDQRLRHPRTRAAAVGSLIVHTVSVALLLFPRALVQMPRDLREPPPSPVISLLAPPGSVLRELTQPAPTEGPPTLEFEGPKETAAPTIVFPEEPKAEPPSPPPEPDPPPEPEPPQIEVEPKPPEPEQQPPDPILAPPAAQSPNPGDFRPGARLSKKQSPDELPMPRRPSRPVERPKLALQNPTTASPGREGPLELGSLGLNARPGQIVRGAIQNLSRGGGTPAKQAVGDTLGAGGLGGYLPPSTGNTGSNLELLSDPHGVDFRPYLIQILSAVRRNWYAVIPESARLGISRGRANIQLAIVRNGTVSKLVIARSSGASALDRAAVAGISASNPFPPLPADFSGTEIRLQFAFLYNIKK